MLAHLGGPLLEPLQLAPAVAFGVLYALRARTLRQRGRPVPGWRQACWYGGLALVVVVLASPLAHVAEELFLAHMAEHLLMADLGGLLLVLGLTGPVLQPVLRVRALAWLRHLAHPAPAFALWTANLVLWHLPGPHEAAVRNEAVHALQHLLLVGCGFNTWMALVGPLPKPAWFGNLARLVYVIAVRLVGTVLANVFVWLSAPLYDVYAPGWAEWGLDGHEDQVVAGSIMMVEGSLVTICLFGWLFLRSAREGEERQALLDLAAERGFALSERRAARAVAGGHGAALRRRIEEG